MVSDVTTDPVVDLLTDIRDRLIRLEAELEAYRYLLPDKDSLTGRALAGKARRAQRRNGA